MAIFRLDIQSIGRSTGRRATDVAAYRSGERLVDERTGAVHDYTSRRDVTYAQIVLPSRLPAGEAGWARDRQQLWNAAERAEKQRNSRFAREYQVSLPSELDPLQRRDLALAFSRYVADRYGVAVDLSIHNPTTTGDPRHFHAHVLTSTREVTSHGFGAKVGLELSERVRRERGLETGRNEFKLIRAQWADLTNEALRAAHVDARVDHRTLAAQGIDREPKHLPWHLYKAAQLRLGRDAIERARTHLVQSERSAASAEPPASAPERAPAATSEQKSSIRPLERRSLEEIRRDSRAAWLAYRNAEGTRDAVAAEPTPQRALGRDPDTDLGL